MNKSNNKFIVVDEKLFDRNERCFMREIVLSIKDNLKKIGCPESKLQDATYAIAFTFASALDNCAGMMDSGNRPCRPVLTFETEPFDYTKLVARSGGTYMHEYIYDIVDEVFIKKKKKK